MKCLLYAVLLLCLFAPRVSAQEFRAAGDTDKEGLVIKSVDGLKFRVPEDMPIEKKNGIVAPMDLTEYVAIKFSRTEKRLRNIQERIEKIEEELNLIEERIESLKETYSQQ